MRTRFCRVLALLLCLGLLVQLCGCKSDKKTDSGTETEETAAIADADFLLTASDVSTPLNGSSELVAFAVDSKGLDYGYNAKVWQGVQNFAEQFNYTAKSYKADSTSTTPAEDALRLAASSGASMVVCAGQEMAVALYSIQDNYPGVNYLLLDAEPHNEDFTTYKTASNVHCILFEEQEAGYLAGYAAVTTGYTQIAFVAENKEPSMVRYGTGFLLGAQAAAELQGVEVSYKMWFVGLSEASDELTDRIRDLYNSGTALIFVAGGNLIDSCIPAAEELDKKVLASDFDQDEKSSTVLCSAVKSYNTMTQKRLYDFYANGGISWSEEMGGSSEQSGYSAGAVGLTSSVFGDSFTQNDYNTLYRRLRSNEIKVGRYSDLNDLPETPNIALDIMN